jgi:NAD(P)-dependent dehydrogenase (short-subunit alcohol dehydrogenase family)
MAYLLNLFQQFFFLPAPTLTERNLPDQTSKVSIVTGGYAGVGLELSKILYAKHGTVYIAGRNADKAQAAIEKIKADYPDSKGALRFMKVDLSDLPTVKPAVDAFLKKEDRLDVLMHNAGVMMPPNGSLAAQGHELTIATNCLGPFLLNQLLTPLLSKTAESSPPGAIRTVWAASSVVDATSPKGGVSLDEAGNFAPHKENVVNYGSSKSGNYFLAKEFARRYPLSADGQGVLSVSFNPGNLRSELQRHMSGFGRWFVNLICYPVVFGAYTELWAGWSPEITPEHNGAYVWPWGRFGGVRSDVAAELREGGNAERFWSWCEKETRDYA